MRFVIPPLAVALLAATIAAAPALKSDTIEGEFRMSGYRDPIVIRKERTPEGEFHDVTYWLVFTAEATEKDADKIESGTTVKVIGTIAAGGQYRYVIVEKISSGKE